jgi:hypothetical protein
MGLAAPPGTAERQRGIPDVYVERRGDSYPARGEFCDIA